MSFGVLFPVIMKQFNSSRQETGMDSSSCDILAMQAVEHQANGFNPAIMD